MTNEDIYNVVKIRLRLQDDNLQPLINTYIEEIRNRILNYCNLRKIPEGLKFTFVSMVMDIIRVDLPSVDQIADTVGENETQVTLGDTTIKYGNSNNVTNVSKKSIEDIVLNYSVDLNRHRKLRW